MYIYSPLFTVNRENLTFIGNIADTLGPSEVCRVMCLNVTINTAESSSTISVTLLNNSGTGGGALFIEQTDGNVALNNIHARDNTDGALGILSATAKQLFFQKIETMGKEVSLLPGALLLLKGITLDLNYASAITTDLNDVTRRRRNSLIRPCWNVFWGVIEAVWGFFTSRCVLKTW